jgi:nucleoside-diphosphate-sugar epimerase
MNVLVTGGAGFIGSYVVKTLADEGHRVTALDRSPGRAGALAELPGVEVVGCDLADFDAVEEHLGGKDACIHLALCCWTEGFYEFLMRDTRISVWLFERAAQLGVPHFIETSSGEAPGVTVPLMDERMRTEPRRAYAASKAAAEQFLMAVSHQYPMRCNILVPNLVFGNPLMEGCALTSDHRIRDICRQARQGREMVLPPAPGTQPIWAGDLARVYVAVLNGDMNRQAYYAMGADFIAWHDVAAEALRLAGSSRPLRPAHGDPGCLFDVTKVREELGLEFHSWPHLADHLAYLIENEID